MDNDSRAVERLGALGSSIKLALHGATEGERANAQAAVDRLLARLTTAEIRVIMRGLPGVGEASKAPPRTRRHRTGTKREQIIELLRQGHSPKAIANAVGCRVQYVYNVKRDYQ